MIVAGPTGSGKSALALALAEAVAGIVINADSMQVYREAAILTARPTPADEARVPHRLFGVLGADDPCSAGRWRALAIEELAVADRAGRSAIVVGGTGLYLEVLLKGLAPVPPIPPSVRDGAARLFKTAGAERFRSMLIERDPQAARLAVSDRQRLLRAWEVVEATGRTLTEWQRQGTSPPARTFVVILLSPAREILYPALDARFTRMLSAGGLDEARALHRRGLDPNLPLLKAVGIRQLLAHVGGALSLEAATAAARLATRHYAKRQMTWFRHRLDAELCIREQFSERIGSEIFPDIRRRLLTGRI